MRIVTLIAEINSHENSNVIVTAQGISNAQTETSFTTSSSGWYRIGGWTSGSAKRGAVRVAVSLRGGSYIPQTLVIDAFKDWSSGISLKTWGIRNTYMQQVRIVDDGDYHLEVYFDRTITSSATIYLYNIEGYSSGFQINSGTLPSGNGSISVETGDIRNTDYFTNNLKSENTVTATQIKTQTIDKGAWFFANASDGYDSGLILNIGDFDKYKIVADDSRGDDFRIYNYTNETDVIYHDINNDRVGIKTNAPAHDIHLNDNTTISGDVVVDGNIETKKIKVTATPEQFLTTFLKRITN